MKMDMATAMALAVIRGDRVAALALADRIKEDATEAERVAAGTVVNPGSAVTGLEVWRWPEFLTFVRRLGFNPSGRVRNLTITLSVDDAVILTSDLVGSDTPATVVNTTGMNNVNFVTTVPNFLEAD